MLKSFFHTGFVVRDLGSSVDFYTNVLGLELVYTMTRTGDYIERLVGFKDAHLEMAFLNMGDGHNLELIQYVVPPSAEGRIERNDLGATHLAFFVENIEEFSEAMSQRGLRFIGPPVPLIQEGKVVRKAIYGQDPNGNWLEFVETPE